MWNCIVYFHVSYCTLLVNVYAHTYIHTHVFSINIFDNYTRRCFVNGIVKIIYFFIFFPPEKCLRNILHSKNNLAEFIFYALSIININNVDMFCVYVPEDYSRYCRNQDKIIFNISTVKRNIYVGRKMIFWNCTCTNG